MPAARVPCRDLFRSEDEVEDPEEEAEVVANLACRIAAEIGHSEGSIATRFPFTPSIPPGSIHPLILFFQVSMFADSSRTVNPIGGKISLMQLNKGNANMLMKPICDSPSLMRLSGSGGPPKRQVGISRAFSISP